jgi:dihydrofolate reductase
MATPIPTEDPKLVLVVARARNGVIGRDGELPWRLSDDLRMFKEITANSPLLMGRKTWESIGRPLPGRVSLVLSRDPAYRAEGAETFRDFDKMRARAREVAAMMGADRICVIGGESLYRLALPLADRLYITEVDAVVEGDAVFPRFSEKEWVEVDRVTHGADERNDHAFTLRVLEREGAA